MASHGESLPIQFSDYEKVYLQLSRAFEPLEKEHLAVHCVCSVDYRPPTVADRSLEANKALRNAWKRLAVEYPGLTVRPLDFTKHYLPLDEAVLEDWACETFVVDDEACADDIIANAKPRKLPSLHYLPQHSEIVLLSQHWRTDALGCCMLLNRFFELLDSGDTEHLALKDTPSLSPSLETAAGASPEEDADIQAYAREYIDAFHAKALNTGGLPFEGDATQLPGRTRHTDLIFSTDDTARLIQACKSQRASVSAAIHVALARTYFSFAQTPEEKETGYTTIMAVNFRPYLPVPYNEPAHACQTYVVSITPTVPRTGGYVDAARALTREYRSWYTDRFRRSLCWLFKSHNEKSHNEKSLATRPPPAAEHPDPAPRNPPSGVTLSSLGIVDRYLRERYGDRVAVGKFRFGVSTMTRQTLLYAWTFRGELTLSLDYNEAYHSRQMADEVLSRVKRNLAEGLETAIF